MKESWNVPESIIVGPEIKEITIYHPVYGKIPIRELKDNLNAAKTKFHYDQLCFTWGTVEALINKVEELQTKLNILVDNL